jgi:hypothetical protein
VTAVPPETDIKMPMSPFDQFTTGVGVRAEVPLVKIDGSF